MYINYACGMFVKNILIISQNLKTCYTLVAYIFGRITMLHKHVKENAKVIYMFYCMEYVKCRKIIHPEMN